MKEEEFYIGWQEHAPNGFKKTGFKFFLVGLLILVVFIGFYVPSQQTFNDSIFEYGELTELEGTLVNYPVYGLKTQIDGKNITVPLVGFGKSGVDALAADLLKKINNDGKQSQVKLRGTLIKYNGKSWMELTEGEQSIISLNSDKNTEKQTVTSLGNRKITGEIVDPKCFFGVMKPAVSKIHKSCAIRCISGGIPPILAVRENGQYVDYYFLTGDKEQSINQEVLSYVGKQIDINGIVEQIDDWKAIKINPNELSVGVNIRLDSYVASCN